MPGAAPRSGQPRPVRLEPSPALGPTLGRRTAPGVGGRLANHQGQIMGRSSVVILYFTGAFTLRRVSRGPGRGTAVPHEDVPVRTSLHTSLHTFSK
eukprot:scaffold76368_cov70-Phaeocystis_antarctica.AAC.3